MFSTLEFKMENKLKVVKTVRSLGVKLAFGGSSQIFDTVEGSQ